MVANSRGQESCGARHRRRTRRPTGSPGLPTDPRIAGGLPTQVITGYSELGRQATNPQWQYPEVWNPKMNYTWVTGRHSLKSGYEFQHIATEVQDVNPLYGRDAYASQFSDPGPASTNNLYNLADFMFGLRSQYTLSNILIANLRQQMHFAYVQDDFRMNDALTLNLGLRYEYATPHWEKDNILSNFDPDTRTMVLASDGSLRDRSLINPDRNNFGPRLGFAWLAALDGRCAAATGSATSTSTAPAPPTSCRSTARRSSTPSPCRRTCSTRPSERRSRDIRSGSPIRPHSTR